MCFHQLPWKLSYGSFHGRDGSLHGSVERVTCQRGRNFYGSQRREITSTEFINFTCMEAG